MNDFEKAAENIGNRFDMVLVAAERMRELHIRAREKRELGLPPEKKSRPDWSQTFHEIETGVVGIDYLKKIKPRRKREKPKFDNI